MLILNIEKREELGKKARKLRTTGMIPVVVYGKNTKATAGKVAIKDFESAWRNAGETTVVQLKSDDKALHDAQVLIYYVDLDPVSDTPRHADLYALQKGQAVQVAVPLEFVGESRAVKEQGGVLVKSLHELEIEAEAANLPHSLEVDISVISDFESTILAKDVPLPAGVKLVTDLDEVVALVTAVAEEPVEEAEKPDLSAIEVQKKGKKEEEEPLQE